jgi:hypothetical protein
MLQIIKERVKTEKKKLSTKKKIEILKKKCIYLTLEVKSNCKQTHRKIKTETVRPKIQSQIYSFFLILQNYPKLFKILQKYRKFKFIESKIFKSKILN